MKYITLLFCSLFLLLTSATTAQAADFIVDYDVTYTVSEQGRTSVRQQVSLINKQSNLYAQQYAIVIDSTKISNVAAKDNIGAIQPQISQVDNKTKITLTFNDEVVGLGNILRFTLTYDDETIAKRNGTIWEIQIPGIAEDQEIGKYSVRLVTPASFGTPAYLVPEPSTNQLVWTKNQLINGGVSAAFGQKQVFDLTLSYYLENTKNQTIITEIALPPSTSFQRIVLQSIDPAPLEIIADEDNNWLARYRLPPQSNLSINAAVIAEVFLQPRSASYTLSPQEKRRYLQQTPYWDTQDSRIKAFAQAYKTPEEIYTHVIQTLNYNYERVNQQITRQGAATALSQPDQAVCMEFTDLFIAIARAAGIPARQAVGYAYTTNPRLRPLSLVSDVLHAWPEYYDESRNLWIGVDPTWGDTTGGIDYFTKLDFNHIVFAYNGIRDDYPYPAGFYRQAGKIGRDVDVRFFEGEVPNEQPRLDVYFNTPQQIAAGLPAEGILEVKNTSKVAAENVLVRVESQLFSLQSGTQAIVVPPYGTLKKSLNLQISNYLTSGKGVITAYINDSLYRKDINIRPAYHVIAPVIIIAIWVSITLLFIIKRITKP